MLAAGFDDVSGTHASALSSARSISPLMVPLIIDSIMPSFSSTRMLSSPMCTLPLAPLRATSTRSPFYCKRSMNPTFKALS